MRSPNIQTPPSISITLALNQDILQEGEAVGLSATAVSRALVPITIRTRDSFLPLGYRHIDPDESDVSY
jgi:hypothetical protein